VKHSRKVPANSLTGLDDAGTSSSGLERTNVNHPGGIDWFIPLITQRGVVKGGAFIPGGAISAMNVAKDVNSRLHALHGRQQLLASYVIGAGKRFLLFPRCVLAHGSRYFLIQDPVWRPVRDEEI